MFNEKGWHRLYEKHNGTLPLKIRALSEGTVIPVKNALMTIENTDPEFPWLTNWAETLLMQVWYPITVATQSWFIKKAILGDLRETGTPEGIGFKLHDFGFRGVSSRESAAIGGCAHLVNFLGTDTIAAMEYAEQMYNADCTGYSIPAMEHSTVTSWGREHEGDSFENMLDSYPNGLVACVIDSYDTLGAVEHIFGDRLRDKILRRNGTVVLRPDSGDPVEILPAIFEKVAEKFGYTVNDKGYKLLPPQVRVIQGDGVNYQSILRINEAVTSKGWSMDNWGYGMGGALLQNLTRDTQRFAIKCSAIRRNGEWQEVHKDPKTDPSKASLGGRFSVVDNGNGDYHTVAVDEPDYAYGNLLQTVFENGTLLKESSLDAIRRRAHYTLLGE